MLLLLIPILFILAYLYATRNFDYWRKRDIPCEKPVPFLGNVPLVLFQKCIGTYMKYLYEKSSGPLYGFFVLDKPFLLVRDPEIMKHILVKDFHMFDNRTLTMDLEADPIGCRTLFVLHNPAWHKVRRIMTMAFSSGKVKQMFPLMTEVGKDFIKYVEKFDGEPLEGKPLTLKFSTDVIASCAFGVKGFSFEKEDSQFLQIRSTFAILCQQQGGLTYDGIKKMTYLDMVLSEVLRRYPSLPFLDRRAMTDYKIPGNDVTIEKGTPVYIPSLGLHFDPQYFPDPKKFDPERFTPEKKKEMMKMQYLPFGEGPRNCIGARFGKVSSNLSVIFMVSEFEVLPGENTPSEVVFDPRGFLLHPLEKIQLRFKKIGCPVKLL